MSKVITFAFMFSIVIAMPAHGQFKKLLVKKIVKTYNSYSGESTTDISLPDSSNASISLSQFKGKIVLLSFWSTTCEPCIAEIPDEQKFYSKMKSSWDSLVWVNISVDNDFNKWKNFIKNTPMPGISLIDSSRHNKVSTKLHVNEYPTYILLDKKGNVIGHQIPVARDSADGAILFYLAMRATAGIRSGDAMIEIVNKTPLSEAITERIISFK